MKKGQISVEYMGVYAWTGLALVLAVGALAYFGVFDSSNYTTESCESGAQLVCSDAYAYSDGWVGIAITNNLPKPIVITSFRTIEPNAQSTASIVINSGETAELSVLSSIEADVGDKTSFDYAINYQRNDITGSRIHEIKGTAVSEVLSPDIHYVHHATLS